MRSTTAVHASSLASAEGALARTQSARTQESGSGSRSWRACTASASSSPSSARRSRTYHARSTSSPASSRTRMRSPSPDAVRASARSAACRDTPESTSWRAVAATCASRPTRRASGAHFWATARARSRIGSATVSTVSTRSTSVSAPTASAAVASAAAEHVPHGGHRDGAGERRGQPRRASDQHRPTSGVGSGGGERAVVVVHQVEVGMGQPLDRGALAVDLHAGRPHLLEHVAGAAVGTDAHHLRVRGPVRSHGGEHRAVVGVLDTQPVDAGGLEPGRAPRLEVTAAGLLEGPDEVVEGGVAPGVLGEVGGHAPCRTSPRPRSA